MDDSSLESSYKTKHTAATQLSNHAPEHLFQRSGKLCLRKKNLYTAVSIFNSEKQQTTKMSQTM